MLIVPDTNILLHYRLLIDIDFKQHVSAEATSVVVPLVVIDELDDKKFSSSKAMASRASAVLRMLERCAAQEAILKGGVGFEILAEDEDRRRRSRPDDEIVRVCNDLSTLRDQSIVLLTSDYGMRLRALARFAGNSNYAQSLPEDLLLKRSSDDDDPAVELAGRGPRPKVDAKSDLLRVTLDGQARLQPQPIPRLRDFTTVVDELVDRERKRVSLSHHEYHSEYREWAEQAVWRRMQSRLAVELPVRISNMATARIETIAVKLTVESKEDDLVFVLSDDLTEENEPEKPQRPSNSTYNLLNLPPVYIPPTYDSDWEISEEEKHAVATVDRVWPDGRDHTWTDGLSVVARDVTSFSRGFSISWELYASDPELSLIGKLNVLPREILDPAPSVDG